MLRTSRKNMHGNMQKNSLQQMKMVSIANKERAARSLLLLKPLLIRIPYIIARMIFLKF